MAAFVDCHVPILRQREVSPINTSPNSMTPQERACGASRLRFRQLRSVVELVKRAAGRRSPQTSNSEPPVGHCSQTCREGCRRCQQWSTESRRSVSAFHERVSSMSPTGHQYGGGIGSVDRRHEVRILNGFSC